MKTLCSIAFVGAVSMIGLLEIGIRVTQEQLVCAETSVSGVVARLPASPLLLENRGTEASRNRPAAVPVAAGIVSSSPDRYSFAAAAELAAAGPLSHLLPAEVPRFARSQECARLREGKSPLKPEITPAQ